MEKIEVRKLPKKSIIYISIIFILAVIVLFLQSFSTQEEVKKHLSKIGYENVGDITVYNKSKMNDEETKGNGKLYKIKFTNINTNQICNGLIFINKFKKIKEDLDCEKIK